MLPQLLEDTAVLEQLKTAHIKLRVSPERPRQITVAALGRAIGARLLLEKNVSRPPKCRQFLREEVENRVQYALRRLAYAAAAMRTVGVVPIPWKLVREARIRGDLRRNNTIRAYVQGLAADSAQSM